MPIKKCKCGSTSFYARGYVSWNNIELKKGILILNQPQTEIEGPITCQDCGGEYEHEDFKEIDYGINHEYLLDIMLAQKELLPLFMGKDIALDKLLAKKLKE